MFARNMDIIDAKEAIKNFLEGLRATGQLMTTEEFNKLDENLYIEKYNPSIDRLQGRRFIEKVAEENGLKSIKVPKKIMVINPDIDTLSIHVGKDLNLIPNNDQVKIFAEKIKLVKRKYSLEEAVELMIVLEKTGYQNYSDFIINEDGIYFIDTQFKHFRPGNPNFNMIKSIHEQLNPEDVEPFLAKYEERKKAFQAEDLELDKKLEEYEETFKNPFKKLTNGYSRHEFKFPVSSLI